MKIIRNISWIFGANLFAAMTKWLILVFIARFLTPNDVGAYSLAFAVGAPITLFVHMKLRSLYITEETIQFSDYLHTRKVMSSLSFIIITFIGVVVYPEYLFIIILVGVNKIFDLHSDLYYALPQKHSDFNYIGKLMISKHLIIIVFFFAILLLTKDLILALLAQCFTQIIIYYSIEKKGIDTKYSVELKKISFNNVKKIILSGLPLGISIMIISFNSNFPKYILEYFESAEILGFFSAISYLLIIGNLVMNAISQNFLPYLSRELIEGNKVKFIRYVFMKLTGFSIALGSITIIFCYLFGEFFLKYIYGEEYVEYTGILILMGYAIAINFVSWNFDTALMAMRYISIQPKIAIFSLFINLIVAYILVKEFGIYGAAYSIILVNLIQLILRVIFVIYGLYRKNNLTAGVVNFESK